VSLTLRAYFPRGVSAYTLRETFFDSLSLPQLERECQPFFRERDASTRVAPCTALDVTQPSYHDADTMSTSFFQSPLTAHLPSVNLTPTVYHEPLGASTFFFVPALEPCGHRGETPSTEQRTVYHRGERDATSFFAPGIEVHFPLDTRGLAWYSGLITFRQPPLSIEYGIGATIKHHLKGNTI